MDSDNAVLVVAQDEGFDMSNSTTYRRLDNHDSVISLLAMGVKYYRVEAKDRRMQFVFVASETEQIMADILSGKEIMVSIANFFKAEKVWVDHLIMMKMKRSELNG